MKMYLIFPDPCHDALSTLSSPYKACNISLHEDEGLLSIYESQRTSNNEVSSAEIPVSHHDYSYSVEQAWISLAVMLIDSLHVSCVNDHAASMKVVQIRREWTFPSTRPHSIPKGRQALATVTNKTGRCHCGIKGEA